MNTSSIVKQSAVLMALVSALVLGEGALAQGEWTGGEEATFDVGGSCAALAYMNAGQLKAFISAGYTDDFHSFCYPEEPSECSDYTPFLKGLGRLQTGDDGFHCSLQLQP